MIRKSRALRFAQWAIPTALAFAFFGWRSYKFIESKRLSPPLIAAVKANKQEQVKSLLGRGADPNARDIPNAPTDFLALLKSIIKPDPSKLPEAFPSALMIAAQQSEGLELARSLLSHGADAKAARPGGGTILTHMLDPYPNEAPSAALFRLLLDHGANPNAIGNPNSSESKPLLLMAYDYVKSELGEKPRPEFLILLLDHGANPNIVDDKGHTLLKIAMDDQKPDLVKHILDAGADPNKPTDSRSPLLDAVQARNPDVVKMLLEKRADPNSVDPEGTTPLMVASFNGDADIVQILLNAGGRIDLKDSEGKTASQYASDSPKIIALLQSAERP